MEHPFEALSPTLRRRIAGHWLTAARAEHASIASFARFTLHLLAVGAPPDLIADSQRAGADEIRHAKLCFRVAARYAGEVLGPGPVVMDDDVIGATDLASITAAAVSEGCIGETLSALEVREAGERATDAEVREVLAEVGEDETRHAELAWRFAGWALERGGASVRAAVEAVFPPQLSAPPVPERDPDETALNAHGVLTPRCRHEIRRWGWEELILPARETLLAP